MSTENGLERLPVARRHVERVRQRIDFLEERCARRLADGMDEDRNGFDRAELGALTWALPLMEAEVDFIRRTKAVTIPAEVRAHRGAA